MLIMDGTVALLLRELLFMRVARHKSARHAHGQGTSFPVETSTVTTPAPRLLHKTTLDKPASPALLPDLEPHNIP
jgi:hypothetical protein